ncbi:MAG: ATP-dependent DNA ligase, partial [Patescibacteria group bacterium]
MFFAELSKYFDKIERISSRLEITRLLSELFTKLSPEEIQEVAYLLQSRVVPVYVKQEFGIAEKLAFKAFVVSFSLEEKSIRAELKKKGDLGEVIEFYRKTSRSLFETDQEISIHQVFLLLEKLSKLTGNGAQDSKLAILSELFRQLDATSCKYLVRIVTGNLRLKFSDMTILDAYSWMLTGGKELRKSIEEKYNVRPDIGYVGRLLKEHGTEGLVHIRPEPGIPILMARAERVAKPEDILEKIGPCAIEPKYDGFRLQIHILKDTSVRIYSRNMDDVTPMFPDIVAAIQKEINTTEVIFEGEAVGYSTADGKYLPFQETVQRKRKYDVVEKSKKIPLHLFAFDVLYKKGISLLLAPYEEREKELRSLFTKQEVDKDTIVRPTTITRVSTAEEIESLFLAATSEGLEGIMAKKLMGKYEAGARGWNWIKFKHSYSSHLNDTIDCVVMGYDLGKGKRTNFGIGAFLIGVFDEEKEKFVTVAKVGTGLTDEEWKAIRILCDEHTSEKVPNTYELTKSISVDQWVNPFIVVEIRADEITKSPTHTAGFALRFPRLERMRPDKKSEQCTTLHELVTIMKTQNDRTY